MIPATPPTIHPNLQKLSGIFLTLTGWRVEGELPPVSKFIIIGAPHTSNWDFIYMLACVGRLGLQVSWMGKDSLFKWPYGWLMTMVGGLPIDRSRPNQVVRQMAHTFAAHEQLVIGILPEGTRRKRDYWKTGFYYIAQAAQVPILVCSVDYARKVSTVGPLIQPGTELPEVMTIIRDFLAGVQGRHPENASDIRVRTVETPDEPTA
jgi:1-acyl-sn-glycerol-3-phosphate acyltransferase